jgi:hypothetical protein
MGYVSANLPDSLSYEPDVRYNSAEEANSVEKLGKGRWEVTLPGIGGSTGRGSVQITASSGSPAVCRVVKWTAGVVVTVACRDADGALDDTSFMLTYMRGRGLKFEGDPNVAYVRADRPATASYQPTAGYRFSSAGGLPVVKRSGTGRYSVKLPGMPLGGSAEVSAFGPGKRRCVVGSIRKSRPPQRIGVRCFTADGSDPADAKFTLHYAR